jgi:ATP-binding cassette, subfamily G (WHITE), member 2, SNQ2
MLNISHTKQTLVGDVSGGERKRVSIAEMMATRARVQCWDNSTRGLDASTALDFVKSLRIMTDVLGQTTFVSLYVVCILLMIFTKCCSRSQAGESIYQLFDKVLVLDQGRQVFYGPPSEARAYFEGLGYNPLPRQTTADYLTGCTDPNERQYAPGRSAQDTPSTPEMLEQVYLRSKLVRDNAADLKEYKLFMDIEKTDQEAFRTAVAADKKKGVSTSSPYTLGFTGQVRALTIRQFQQRLQDKFQLYTSFSLSIVGIGPKSYTQCCSLVTIFFQILGIVIGVAYYNQPLTSAGAFTRGGVFYATLLTICLNAFGEVGSLSSPLS